MPTNETIEKPFSSYQISYGITNPNGKDLARIEFFQGATKVGQALLGDAITPGAFAGLVNETEIHLYFPMSHFPNLLALIRTENQLSLFLEVDVFDAHSFRSGGIVNRQPQ